LSICIGILDIAGNWSHIGKAHETPNDSIAPYRAPTGFAPDPFEEKEINKNKIKDLPAARRRIFLCLFVYFFSLALVCSKQRSGYPLVTRSLPISAKSLI
jgi:hypothetical protein